MDDPQNGKRIRHRHLHHHALDTPSGSSNPSETTENPQNQRLGTARRCWALPWCLLPWKSATLWLFPYRHTQSIEAIQHLLQKKTNRHPKANGGLRKNFLKLLHRYIRRNRPVVYLDESGFRKSCYRPYAYAQKSRRCYALHDWQGHHQTNAIGALFHGKLFAVGLFDYSIDRRIFDAWVERILIPELPPNSAVVMDNATFHGLD